MSSWGQSVRDLTAQLNQFGNSQRGIAQTDIANQRAGEMLNLSKQSSALQARAEKLNEERFGQQVLQEKQNQAVGGLKAILTMEMGMPDDKATNIINYVSASKGAPPQIQQQMARIITPEIVAKIKGRMSQETMQNLPSVWRDYLVGGESNKSIPGTQPQLRSFSVQRPGAVTDMATEIYKQAVPRNLPGVTNTYETPTATPTPISEVGIKSPESYATELAKRQAIVNKKRIGLMLLPEEQFILDNPPSQIYEGYPQGQ
jgi:hypothetical protein